MSCNNEVRKGFSFCNPDTTANNGWGAIVTPDELRYTYAFGNDLVAPNGQTITDCTLQWYIDQAVANVERDLNVTLIKKQFRHTPINKDGTFVSRSDLEGEPDIDYVLWLESKLLVVINLNKQK